MCKHIKFKKSKRQDKGYIVYNTITGAHTHIATEEGCWILKSFIRKNIVPDNPYLKESYKRLTISGKQFYKEYILKEG